jgi:hypothetical protein
LVVPNAFGVHDTGAFELEGNATNDPAVNGDDWDNVCYQVTQTEDTGGVIPDECDSAGNTSGATAVSWTAEPNPNFSIFTGGGSKDPQDVSNWAWKNAGGLPDKDNLLHSFAARYSLTGTPAGGTCPNGTGDLDADGDITDPGEVAFDPNVKCEVLFFGSDRFDNSGDAQQGFWFFQNPIGLTNISSGGGFKFSGVHKNGDLLIISDFSNGGTVSTISVYKWNSAISGNLQLLATSTAAKCTSAAAGDGFCGIVNPGTITMPWSFVDKSGTSGNQALNGEFYEGGINLSLLGLGGECFSSVSSETRSSTSPTATLKDFVLGGFGKCVATLSTQVSDAGPVIPGTAVTDTLTVTSSNASKTATGDVEWFLCATTTSCSSGGTDLGSSALSGSGGTATAVSPEVNTGTGLAPGRYCFRAEWPGDGNFTDGPYSEFGGANGTNECFTVKDTSSISTAQSWLPQDSATVTTAGGTPVSGTVVFSLYESADCTGTATEFTDTDGSDGYATNNSTYRTASTTISWSATFTPSDENAVQGSTTTRCEKSVLTIDNSASVFPPPTP